MSKKIISAILVMAMVISMSATALLSSVGAAAETEVDYEADREILKTMLQEFVVEGPQLNADTIEYLETLKILTWNGDKGYYNEENARKEFWDDFGGETNYTYFFKGEDADFAKNFVTEGAKKDIFANTNETWATTTSTDVSYLDLAVDNISTVIEYAASAWYFGKEANDANADASFNEGRNEVVKKAIGMVNTVLDLLKNEVKADSDKPADYAKEFNGEFYRGFATMSKAYNQSIGFNPYLFILDADNTESKTYFEDSYYLSALGQYTVRWYTFAEAREIDAKGVFEFENMIRTMAIDGGAGVLFYDFVNGNRKDFLDIVDSLFTNLVGKIEDSFFSADIDEQIKAFLKLDILVDLYDLYIKDVYNNIYTATSAELLNDVLYAKRIIDYVCDADGNVEKSKLMTLILVDCGSLTNDILAGIEAVAPRTEQLLKAAEITEGSALVRKAEALLTNWASWESNDSYKDAWAALNKAKNNLKNMLPVAEGADTVIVVEANSRKLKNFADKEIGNDRIIVEFAPNYFSYIKLYAELKAQIDVFTGKITGDKASLDAPNLTKVNNSDLVKAINKYTHLIGIVGDIVEYVDRTCDGKDNPTINFVKTTEWTYCGEKDHGKHWKEDTFKATREYRATVKYMSYLFKGAVAEATTRPDAVLPGWAFASAPAKGGADVYSDTNCYVCVHYDDDYLDLIGYGDAHPMGLLMYNFLENDGKVNSMYELVLGHVDGNNDRNKWLTQDVAIDAVYVLMSTIIDAAEYAVNEVVNHYAAGDDWYTDYEFDAEGKFDWVNDSYVFTSGHDKVVNAINDAVKNLTKDLTTRMQTYAVIFNQVRSLFQWTTEEVINPEGDVSNVTYINKLVANKNSRECWVLEKNYADGAMDAALEAANELYSYLNYYTQDLVENENGVEEIVSTYKFATYSKLIAAYDNFVNAIKTYLFTAAGAEKFDAYVEDVYYMINTYLGADNDTWNSYDKLMQKLEAAYGQRFRGLTFVMEDMRNCYEYYALTLAHAAECELYFGNRYSNVDDNTDDTDGTSTDKVVTPFEKNLLNPLNGHIGTFDASGYTREWAGMYNAVRQIAAGIVEASKNLEKCDMPVWYAERVLKECNDVKADGANYTTAKLVEYKAGLEALLIEADGLNVYNYVSNTDEAKAIWAAFVEAYANAQYTALDTRCAKSDVDEAVAALEAAMAELAKIEAPEGAADADTLAAKIAAAEALYARADVTDADKADLEVAIAAAKKVLQFNISVLNSTDIEAEIKVLDDLMNALLDTMYTGKDLKKAVKVLELQVVVDLYTEASYRKFANAVEAAYAMAEEDTATESAMKAAYANVEARFGDLKLAPVEEEPEVVEPETSVVMEEAIAIYNDAANGYDKAVEGCTAESAAAYNAAINTLKADIENNADDAKLLESIIALNLAKAALTVDVPETCDC